MQIVQNIGGGQSLLDLIKIIAGARGPVALYIHALKCIVYLRLLKYYFTYYTTPREKFLLAIVVYIEPTEVSRNRVCYCMCYVCYCVCHRLTPFL